MTDTCDYDFGSGTFGPLLRHSHTDYLKIHPVSGVDYANSTFNLSQPKRNIHLRNLPLTQIINTNCSNTLNQAARTDYEYDNYTADSNHAPLTARADISSQYSFFDTTWTTRGNVTGVTRWLNIPAGSITSYQQYDIAGNLTKTIDPLGRATTADYSDNFGNPDGSTDERFNPTELGGLKTYAFATSVTNALLQTSVTQFNYYAGKAVDAKDPNGVVTSAYYQDVLDRPSKLIHAANDFSPNSLVRSQTTFSYDDSSRTITTRSDQTTPGDGLLRSDVIYDGLGRTIETRQYETGAAYITTRQTYDAMGRVKRSYNPYRTTGDPTYGYADTGYDGLGRVKTVTTSDNAVVTTAYSGNATTVTDQASKQRRSITDGLGRLIRVDEPDASGLGPVNAPSQSTSYVYAVLDDLVKVTQGAQNRYFAYDSLKRLIRARNPEQDINPNLTPAITDPVTGNSQWCMKYGYDANSNLTSKTDARNIATNYNYVVLNRVTSRTYTGDPQNTPAVSYVYDSQSLPTGAPSGFNRGSPVGRLVAVTYGGTSAGTYTGYDQLGRGNVSVQQTDSQNYGFGYGYNLAGEMTTETYPSGRVITSGFDTAGRLSSVNGQKTGEPSKTYASQFSYAAHGAVASMTLGNNLVETTTFNTRLQPAFIKLGTASNPTSVLQLGYEYTSTCQSANNGNVLKQTITAPGLSLTQNYCYDALNRLSSANENNGSSWTQTFDYDRYGNGGVRSGHEGYHIELYKQSGGDVTKSRGEAAEKASNTFQRQVAERIGLAQYEIDHLKQLEINPGTRYKEPITKPPNTQPRERPRKPTKRSP